MIFELKFLILFIIKWSLILKLCKGDCVTYDLLDEKKCSLCAAEFFNSNEEGNQTINITDCKPKEKSVQYIKTVFVSPQGCFQTNCQGSKEDPFPNLPYALYFIMNKIKPFLYSQIEIILLGENHYVYPSQILSTKQELLKRCLIDIEIRPELLNITSNIILKTDTFHLFISRSLFLRNLKFIGNDISTKNLTCKESQAICCEEESLSENYNTSDCGLKGLKLNQTDEDMGGFINMEPLIELSVPIVPSLKIHNCSFENWNPSKQTSAFNSLISTRNSKPFSINIENSYFSLDFFSNGIIHSSYNKSKVKVCFLIKDNGSILELDTNILYGVDSQILIFNTSALYFNKVGINYDNFDKLGNLFTFENFRGAILMEKLEIISSIFSGPAFKITVEEGNPLYYSNFSMKDVFFSDITCDYLMIIGNFGSAKLTNISLTKSILTSGFSIFSTSFSAKGIFIYESLLPSDTLFELKNGTLILDQLIIKNAKSPSPDFYLIESRSLLNGPIDAFVDTPLVQEPSFTNDRIIISNSALENGNYLLFTYENAVFSVKLYNITVRNISTKSSQPFIDILCEKELSVVNSTFELLILNGKLVYSKFGKNLTFIGCLLADSQFSAGFDYFVKAYIILESYKIISNFSHCVIKNIKILSPVPGPLTFFFYNPYSRMRGFYLALFENITFENITSGENNPFIVTLMSIASGHLKILKCSFNDIGNMGLHKFFCRLPDSGVELISTIYRLHMYKVSYIFNIGAEYFVKNLVLKNNLISAFHEFSSFNTFSFLNVYGFVFCENIVQNIFNTFGNSITVKLNDLNQFMAEGNFFYNNSGSNSVSADFSIETLYSSDTDFQALSKSTLDITIGLRNSTFIFSRNTGSVYLNDNGELVFEDCRFLLTDGDLGGSIRAGQRSKLLLRNVSILFSNALQNGGSIYILNTLLILIQTKIIRTNASKLGGAISFSRDSVLLIHHSLFEFSYSTKGGFLWGDNSSVVIRNSHFNQSEASVQGGHISLKESYLEIVNSSFSNGASSSSGSLYGEEIIFWMENSTVSNTNSITSVFFLSGVEGRANVFRSTGFFNNFAGSGSCFYALDLNLTMENCILRNNSARPSSVINIFYSTRKTSLVLLHSLFENNRGFRSLLQSTSTIIQIDGSLFIDNFVANQLLFLKNAFFVSSRSVFKISYSDKFPFFFLFFIAIERSQLAKISNNVFNGGRAGGHLEIRNTQAIEILNSLFENGYSESKVGSSLFYESNVSIYGSYFSNNSGPSGALEVFNTFMLLEASSFKSNSASRFGSDLSISSISQKNPFFASIRGVSFISFKPLSIHDQYCLINVEESLFLGHGKANLKSGGVKLVEVNKFSIAKTLLMDFFEDSGISGTNSIASLSEFSSFNSIFINSKAITDGAFIFLYGRISLRIISCYFFRGLTELNGGGIAYICIPPACYISFDGATIFEENRSGNVGHCVYSPSSKIFLVTDIKIISSGNYSDLYSNPSNMLLVFNISSFEELKLYATSLANRTFYSKQASDQIYFHSVKGGEKFNFGAVLIDDFGNIQKTHSKEIILLKPRWPDENIEIINNYDDIREGLAYFEDVKVIGDLNTTYSLTLAYSSNEINLNKGITIELKVCMKGETLIDRICIECPVGSFSLIPFLRNDSVPECLSCLRNSICLGGDRVIPEYGYYRFNENSTIIKMCQFPDACPIQESWKSQTTLNFINFNCGEGYWGNLCKICAPYYSLSNKGCVSCDNLWKNIVLALKILRTVAFTLLECHMTLTRLASPEKALLKILFFHGTYLTIIRGEKIGFSEEIKEVFDLLENVFSVTTQDILDLECFLYPHIEYDDVYAASLSIKLSSIVIFSLFFFIIYTILEGFYLFWERKNLSAPFLKNLFSRSKYNFLVIILITFRNFYRQTLLHTMILFQCEALSDEPVKYLSDNPNIECWGKRHFEYLSGVTITGIIIWSIIFQLVVFKYVYKYSATFNNRPKENIIKIKTKKSEDLNHEPEARKRINGWKTMKNFISDKIPTSPRRLNNSENFILLYLTKDYKKKFYYWINIEYISIFFLVFVSQIISDLNGNIRKLILFVSFSCLFLIYKIVSPMANEIHSKMIKFSLLVCIVSLLSQVIASEKNDKEFAKVVAQFMVSLTNGAFYLIDLYLIAKFRFAKIRALDSPLKTIKLLKLFSGKRKSKVVRLKLK